MTSTFNISFTIAAIFISGVLLLIVSMNYSSTNMVNRRFKMFLIASLLMYVFDILSTLDLGTFVPNGIKVLLNSLYFLSGAIVALLFFYYCFSLAMKGTKPTTRKKFYMANVATLAIYVIALIVNAFAGFFFYFDAEGVYCHGPLYILVNLPTVLYLIECLVTFIVRRKQFNLRQLLATATFFTLFFAAFFLQLFAFQNVLLSSFGCAVGSLIVFFSIETPDYINLMSTLNELNDLKASLEEQVENRTHELDVEKASYQELTLETLSSLALLVDAKDHYTQGHSFRVAAYAKALAEVVRLRPQECQQIYFAGLIHDVGKIGISETILRKPGKLTAEEYKAIQQHAALGGDILQGIRQFPVFEQVARYHHERYDGGGYPEGLKMEQIPYPARIVAVCDAFDAMTSDRSYRSALSDEVAISELVKNKGIQFDPYLVDAFLSLCGRYSDSLRQHVDELAALTAAPQEENEEKPKQP